jgi:hypothetical protein
VIRANGKDEGNFIGLIDNIRIWEKPLSIKEIILRNYTQDALLLSYTFRDGGAFQRNNYQNIKDVSKNGLHATGFNVVTSEDIPPIFRSSPVTYKWTSGDTLSTISVAPKEPTLYKVAISQLNSIIEDSVLIIPLPSPPTIKGETSVIKNSVQEYSTPLVSGSQYQWMVSGGNIITGQNSPILNVEWGKKGKGAITLQETTIKGCKSDLVGIQVEIKKK